MEGVLFRLDYLIYGILTLLLSIFVANALAFVKERSQSNRIMKKTHTINTEHILPTKIPVTILTGFLGSGKTTLINRILRDPKVPYRILVIENEIGMLSIDDDLLQAGENGHPSSGIYVMANGCICCTTKSSGNELEGILDHLINLPSNLQFDYLIVEMSGLADPGPIIRAFLMLRPSHFVLDRVIAMVCSKSIYQYIQGRHANRIPCEVSRQLVYADIILLNKQDLVDSSQLETIQREIVQWNSNAKVLICHQANIPVQDILNVKIFRMDSTEKQSSELHTSGVHSVHFVVQGSLVLNKFHSWLAKVVDEHKGKNIFRVKGILAVQGETTSYVVHCVLDTFSTIPFCEWKNEERLTKLVFIGYALDPTALWNGLQQCFVSPYTRINYKPTAGSQQNVYHLTR